MRKRTTRRKNETEVVVDNINLNLIPSRAAAEVSAQKGHDLVMFLAPPSVFEEQVVDMADVYAECEKKHGPGDERTRATSSVQGFALPRNWQ